jgi:hypothetical protein
MLARAADALVPGGRFALDFMNVPQVLRGFRRSVTITRDRPHGRITLTRDTTLDLAAGVMHKRWRYELPDGSRPEYASRLRMYMPAELVALLASVGFEAIELYGDETGEPLTLDSPRCIVVARKAAA